MNVDVWHIRKRHYDDGNAKNVVLQESEKFKSETYLQKLDNLFEKPSSRLETYSKISFLLGFLVDFLLREDSKIRKPAQLFSPEDIEFKFADEMVHFKHSMQINRKFKMNSTYLVSGFIRLFSNNLLQSMFQRYNSIKNIHVFNINAPEESFRN
ncbi:hypothetical protein TNCT_295571 [Trichonephila clavata]|uniref:Uncharacterized protein n=1 Tax=Trichonephila clavata TaxID=2740835 RepID=A0A8X6M5A9_TRICU|nr:hypothetical protein TNCT_295571 [Trichonephila clavata]